MDDKAKPYTPTEWAQLSRSGMYTEDGIEATVQALATSEAARAQAEAEAEAARATIADLKARLKACESVVEACISAEWLAFREAHDAATDLSNKKWRAGK